MKWFVVIVVLLLPTSCQSYGHWPLNLTGIAFAGDLPDANLTPGDTNPALTKERICSGGFSTKSVRHVTKETRAQAFSTYHMDNKKLPCPCELDHLVSLELGGSNDVKNLWPQSFSTKPWNALVKDKLENELHRRVCAGTTTLPDAQKCISGNWIECYKRYMQ